MRGDNHMSRKRKSIISLVTVALLSMCLALPVFAKAEARLPAGTCPKCKQKTAIAYYDYGPWKIDDYITHGDHTDVKYLRYKHINIQCNNCGYKDREAAGTETQVVCPNN